jgi:cobalt-zinc-cadmium efflux system membrane fusion protein
VVKVAVQLGERVKAGQTLVILSSEQLGGAKTEYLSSKSLLGIAKQHLDREETLYAQKISPQKDVLQARADYDTALAHYKTARERLRLLIPENDLAHVTWNENGTPLSEFALTSPLAGTVVKRDITVGSMIDASDEPLTVINLDPVWVVANVFEHDLAELHEGAEATITVGALPNRRFDGRVTYIADTVDPKTRTVQARVEVPNQDHLLKLGMFAHLRIASGQNGRDVVAVPATALFDVGNKKVVFVALGQGRYEPRQVEIGERGDQTVEIITGLKPGEEVVTRGGLLLKTLALNRGE